MRGSQASHDPNYQKKRLVIVHEKSDLSDAPRFLLRDSLHWGSSRIFATWSYQKAFSL